MGTKSKHTAGPWYVHEHTDTHKKNFDIRIAGGPGIGKQIARVNSNVGLTHEGYDVPRATAHLVAAAPELLSALKGAQLALRKALPHLPADDEAIYCGEWLDEIKEAIAKARGE